MTQGPVPDLDWQRAIEDPPQPLVEHLIELRKRLIASLSILALGTALCYRWSGELLAWLARPAGILYFNAPTDAFYIRLKAAALGGLALTLPLLIHQAWLFVARAAPPLSRRALARLLPLSYGLFLLGAGLALFVVVPAAMRFLLSYSTDDIRPLLTLSAYLEFVASLSLAFGVVFQIPVILFGLNRLGLVSRAVLAQRRRYVYLLSVAAAAFLTPGPDMFSQVALAVPAVLLFELALLTLD
jgi:sec-independent protein translocase protein TatC